LSVEIDSLIGKAKEENHSLLPTGRHMFSCFQKAGLHHV